VKLTALATTANGRFCFQFAAKAIGTQTPEKRHRTNQLTRSTAAARQGRPAAEGRVLVRIVKGLFTRCFELASNAE
jgi:hypothetical protein